MMSGDTGPCGMTKGRQDAAGHAEAPPGSRENREAHQDCTACGGRWTSGSQYHLEDLVRQKEAASDDLHQCLYFPM